MLINEEIVADSAKRLQRAKLDPDRTDEALDSKPRQVLTRLQRDERFRTLLSQTQDTVAARTMLERVLEGNDLVGINYLSIGAFRARSVCRVHLRDENNETVGFGTGFLVAPGVIMTNHHVISSAQGAANSLVEFDYEYDAAGVDRRVVTFALRTDLPLIALETLDFCLVGVAPRSTDNQSAIGDYGWLPLIPTPGKAFVGEYLTIVQHPGGERKQVCVRENKLLKYDENGSTIWYKTDTVAGSSGSPVFNQSWQVVALHHSGVPATDSKGRWLTIDGKVWTNDMDQTRVKWLANEGIRVSAICDYLRSRQAGQPLARAVLGAGSGSPRPVVEMRDVNRNGRGGASAPWDRAGEMVDGELRVTIPVEVAVRVGPEHPRAGRKDNQLALIGAPPSAQLTAPAVHLLSPAPISASIPSGVESVVVDQTNYPLRTGYDPHFLGSNGLAIPLPTLRADLAKKAVRFTVKGKPTTELRYWDYSVVMNKARRLAFFSIVNVDASRRPKSAGRDGDRWFLDNRIDNRYQLGADFYGRQREFEVDRAANPFDRGHLTRRLDAQWGRTPPLAKRNGDDSFHWTNCAPQHFQFNQGAKRWLGLEDFVIQSFAHDADGKATVINGPVFDAPLSSIDGAGRVLPDLAGKPRKDPTFGGVAIPKMFFKIVACVGPGGRLGAAGFLMSQEDLLATVDRIAGLESRPEETLSNAEARLYQVRLADIAHLTGLNFGPLTQAEVEVDESALATSSARLIDNLEDIQI